MTHPPFNIRDWGRNADDDRWEFGVPPTNNANYAWLQHAVSKLSDRGTACVVLANGSMASQTAAESQIRRALIEADLVAAMVALPGQLFHSSALPACFWVLAKDKSPHGSAGRNDRRGQILFIDARAVGVMVDRSTRTLGSEEIATIAGAYQSWRGTTSSARRGDRYQDEPGFCVSAGLDTVREHGYVLAPARYVGVTGVGLTPTGPEVPSRRPAGLTKNLFSLFD
jgi:type I restriction enzyme M protein